MMKQKIQLFITSALMLLLFSAALMAQTGSQMRAVQIHVMPGKTLGELSTAVSIFKAAGFNTIIVRIFQNEGDRFHAMAKNPAPTATGVYFQTSKAPLIEDLITPLSIACREHGIKLIAWVTTRTMDWLEMPDARDIIFNPENSAFVYTNKFDLFNENYEKYLRQLLSDLASQPIDGIIFQDDFSILAREGFSDHSIRRYYLATGKYMQRFELVSERKNDINFASSLFQQWAVFKSYHLQELGNRLVRYCKIVNPKLKIGLNVYYDSVFSVDNGKAWFGQDIESLPHSAFDQIFLMAYHDQLAGEENQTKDVAVNSLKIAQEKLRSIVGDRLITKIQIKSWRDGEAINEEEIGYLQSLVSESKAGLVFTPFDISTTLQSQLSIAMQIMK
jgi:uncharacterized lipoprotein YddW (UPF0748 family)